MYPGSLGQLFEKIDALVLMSPGYPVWQALTSPHQPMCPFFPGQKTHLTEAGPVVLPSWKVPGWNFSGCQGRPKPQEEGGGGH